MPLGAEWMTEEELAPLYKRHKFSLGWWQMEGRPRSDQGEGMVLDKQQMRFGIADSNTIRTFQALSREVVYGDEIGPTEL